MNTTKRHRFKIGKFLCVALADGEAEYGFDKLSQRFSAVPEATIKAGLRDMGANPEENRSFYNTLLIDTGSKLILVDGGERSDRHATAGYTRAALAEIGVQPGAIDEIIITHAHGDHVVGLFEPDDQTLTYPNATYWINRVEWAYWTAKESPASSAMAHWLVLLKPKINLFEIGNDLFPGIQPIAAYGHTPGHTTFLIESEGESLFHAVDLVHHPAQFPNPDWSIKFDTDPRQAVKIRFALFNQLAAENRLTFFFHMPFPGLGRVQRGGKEYKWVAEGLDGRDHQTESH
ncbi:MAG: MBL fold metallo-hydrolase [Chloroflexota bacterium]